MRDAGFSGPNSYYDRDGPREIVLGVRGARQLGNMLFAAVALIGLTMLLVWTIPKPADRCGDPDRPGPQQRQYRRPPCDHALARPAESGKRGLKEAPAYLY